MKTREELVTWIETELTAYKNSGVYTDTMQKYYSDLQTALFILVARLTNQPEVYTVRYIGYGTESLYPESILESLLWYDLIKERPPGRVDNGNGGLEP